MKNMPPDKLVDEFREIERHVLSGLITPAEFANWALHNFSELDCVFPGIVPTLWELIAKNVRSQFEAKMYQVLQPGFMWQPTWIGPGRSKWSVEEIRRDDELRLERIRRWANEFQRFWANADGITHD